LLLLLLLLLLFSAARRFLSRVILSAAKYLSSPSPLLGASLLRCRCLAGHGLNRLRKKSGQQKPAKIIGIRSSTKPPNFRPVILAHRNWSDFVEFRLFPPSVKAMTLKNRRFAAHL
jgi:hypothetical protein